MTDINKAISDNEIKNGRSIVKTSINDVSASPSAAAQDYANVLRQLENELGSLADTSEHKHDPS